MRITTVKRGFESPVAPQHTDRICERNEAKGEESRVVAATRSAAATTRVSSPKGFVAGAASLTSVWRRSLLAAASRLPTDRLLQGAPSQDSGEMSPVLGTAAGVAWRVALLRHDLRGCADVVRRLQRTLSRARTHGRRAHV